MRTNLNIRKEMTLEDIRNVSPSVFAEHAYEGVSDRYEFIKTSDIVENLLTGGMVGQSKTGKFLAARAITGLNADNKFNQDLWNLTESTAKLISV